MLSPLFWLSCLVLTLLHLPSSLLFFSSMPGYGRRKGTMNARMPFKVLWMRRARVLRRLLKKYRDSKKVSLVCLLTCLVCLVLCPVLGCTLSCGVVCPSLGDWVTAHYAVLSAAHVCLSLSARNATTTPTSLSIHYPPSSALPALVLTSSPPSSLPACRSTSICTVSCTLPPRVTSTRTSVS